MSDLLPAPTLATLSSRARRHLARRDPVLKALLARVGPCTLQPGGEPFGVLVRAIIGQLISTLAARTITARLEAAVAETGVTPAAVIDLGEAGLRAQGLSTSQARAVLDLAARGLDQRIPFATLHQLSDEEIVTALTAVRGIGVWTAEMFLIFGTGRPDVLPVADFGLRAGVKDCYALDELPNARRLREIAAPWQPYRSFATWYIWRSRGFVPQS